MSQIRRATWWQCFSRPASAPKIKKERNKKQSPSLSQSSSTSFLYPPFPLLPFYASDSYLKLNSHCILLHFISSNRNSFHSWKAILRPVRFSVSVSFSSASIPSMKTRSFSLKIQNFYLFIYRLFLTLLLFKCCNYVRFGVNLYTAAELMFVSTTKVVLM